MISKEDVLHIAKLARLQLTEQEVVMMQKDLSSILDYFDILKKAPIFSRKIKDSTAPENGLRPDVAASRPASLANNLVAASLEPKDGYIKVKQVL